MFINPYRYGFNGKESDSEVKGQGDSYDYGMRIYDPRIGKFLSVDPLTKKYPMLTPYQFATNSPIWMIDIDGLEGTPYSNLSYTTPANAYGVYGKDWYFAGADEAGQANEQGGHVDKFKYYNYSTPNGTYYIAQAKVSVTTSKEVEEEQWIKVVDVIPAIPPTGPTTKTEHNSIGGELAVYGNGVSTIVAFTKTSIGLTTINAQKGKITGIVLTIETDNPLNMQIADALAKEYGVPVTTVKSTTPIVPNSVQTNPDISVDFKYDTQKVIPGKAGKPERRLEKWVKKVVTKTVTTTTVKQ